MIKPILKKLVSYHEYEFAIANEKLMIKWTRVDPDPDTGKICHSVTVHRWEHVGGEMWRWFLISDTPVIIRKWLPTEKRSRKLLQYYL